MANDTTDDSTPKRLLGEILLSRNYITKEQLTQALEEQKKQHAPLGEILIRLGFVEERDVVVALVVQCNVPYIAIEKYDIAKEILQLLPADFAKKNFVIPLDRADNVLSVVMADPLDEDIKKELGRLTNCRIAAFIATKTEINRSIERLFGQVKKA